MSWGQESGYMGRYQYCSRTVGPSCVTAEEARPGGDMVSLGTTISYRQYTLCQVLKWSARVRGAAHRSNANNQPQESRALGT